MKTLILAAIMAMVARFVDAGALDNPNGGLQTSNGIQASAAGARYTLTGSIFQRTSEGFLIQTSSKARSGTGPRGLVFLKGSSHLQKFNGDKISVSVVPAGTYAYEAVAGNEQVIQAFALVQ